jgi:hypothetical protein
VSPERLLVAYRHGIFPWPARGYPLLWFSPDPRFALTPSRAHVSRSLRKLIRKGQLRVTADTAFDDVITACAAVPRPHQQGTWITRELQDGYRGLHELGYAHSIEAWHDDELVGGLYGVRQRSRSRPCSGTWRCGASAWLIARFIPSTSPGSAPPCGHGNVFFPNGAPPSTSQAFWRHGSSPCPRKRR